MPGYRAPVDDVMFLLDDVFHIDRYNNLPGFAEATPDRDRGGARPRRQNSPNRFSPRSTASATRKAAAGTTTAR